MKRLRWTERRFNFDYPPGMFPFLVERLRGTAPRIADLAAGLDGTLLTRQLNGRWSIQEHIGHLIDLEELHDGRIDDYLNGAPVLRAADMENKKTYAARHNEQDLAGLLSTFKKVRSHFISRLEKLDPERSALHPRLQQPMRVVDLAYFVAEHDDWHLTLMREESLRQ
ncbi:MAG: DinB family protein [Bacteroidota bacterium]